MASPRVRVLSETEVYTLVLPNNGSGPLWCRGCTEVVRLGKRVFVSQMETSEWVPPLCNTRWRLLEKQESGWSPIAEADDYRQREPCPLAVTDKGELFMNVNTSAEPPGVKYGRCMPHLLRFRFAEDGLKQDEVLPMWQARPFFTDHSYRGYAADPAAARLLMLNIDARTSIQHACLLTAQGETLANGSAEFPIRACYPQVALVGDAVHVLAVSDIPEPVKEWHVFKSRSTGSSWDYVFRILFYTSSPNLREQDFGKPIEIANVDDTAGHVSNKDLWISPEGEAYILYSQEEVHSALVRDEFFPGKSTVPSLHLAVVKDGAVVRRHVLLDGASGVTPAGSAWFHVTADKTVYVLAAVNDDGLENWLIHVYPSVDTENPAPIPLVRPFASFCIATVRAGNAPSNTIDLFGSGGDRTYSHAEVVIVDTAQ